MGYDGGRRQGARGRQEAEGRGRGAGGPWGGGRGPGGGQETTYVLGCKLVTAQQKY